MLDELGFECDRATSAAVAANLRASRPCDAARLDIEMPFKDGAELADETRRGKGPNAGTRFIGMSAGEVGEAIKLRFDVCLAKPIDHRALRHALLGSGSGARLSQPGPWTQTRLRCRQCPPGPGPKAETMARSPQETPCPPPALP